MKKHEHFLGRVFVGVAALIFAVPVFAAAEDEEEKICIKPKFYEFAPKHLSEVAPGSEISFKVARVKKPEEVHLQVKQIPVPLVAENKELYYEMKGKLPAELRGTFARVNVRAVGEGGCHVDDGWLLKITE